MTTYIELTPQLAVQLYVIDIVSLPYTVYYTITNADLIGP